MKIARGARSPKLLTPIRLLILLGMTAAMIHPFYSFSWEELRQLAKPQQQHDSLPQPVNYQGDAPHCTPPHLDEPGLEEYGCQIVRNVCLDGDKANIHGMKPDQKTKWPFFDMAVLAALIPGYEEQDIATEYPGMGQTINLHFPVFRRISPLDRFDHVDPVFSNCTVPFLFGLPYLFSYADMFANVFQSIYVLQQEMHLIDENITLTPLVANYRLPESFLNLMRGFSRHKAIGFEDFGSRVYMFDPAWPRCFSKLLICKLRGLWVDSPDANYPVDDEVLYPNEEYTYDRDRDWTTFKAGLAGDFLVEYYKKENLLPTLNKDPETLDITIAVRNGKRLCRNFLKIDKFIENCNKWLQPTENFGGRKITKVRCTPHVFGEDFPRDLALMQKSDILLGHHGAELANGWFMKENSSVIEVRMFGFDGSWPDMYYRSMMRSEDYVFYWQAKVVSDDLWKPCVFEIENAVNRHHERDRHTVLRFKDFEPIFSAILKVNRSREAYVKLEYEDVRWEI